MMTRRRLLFCGLLASVAVVVLCALWLLLAPPTSITRENYDKIHKGMSRGEVEAILGEPNQIAAEPRWHAWFKAARGIAPAWAVGDWQQCTADDRYAHTLSWYSLETWIEIDLDDHDRVCGMRYKFSFDPNK